MNRLQLATLLSWAGDQGLNGRKRLQKVVYLLQQAGCPLGCRFTLHYYGPYSRDVADTCDEMVAAGLVEESGGPAECSSYSYKLEDATHKYLAQAPHAGMEKFEKLGKDLIKEDLWVLELGSTIRYFFEQTRDWSSALEQACKYKKTDADQATSQNALALAKRVSENPLE